MARTTNYKKGITDTTFLQMCKQGCTLTQIADTLESSREEFERWAKDPRKPEFSKVWERGKIAQQSFHEGRLQELISNGESGAAKSQMDFMSILFDEWNKKSETTITVEDKRANMSTNELLDEFVKLSSKSDTKKMLKDLTPEQKH